MNKLRLGIIGLSEGNGHPYSWSAIFNGYDKKAMAECPFPAIPEYLSRQEFPRDAIKEGEVTHVWTQDRFISQHIAKACHIKNIVDDYKAMVGKVDAILLARDDAENHLEMSKPFLKAGLPVYIDKPLAFDVETAERIFGLEQYKGQIFTCSALGYAKEFQLTDAIRKKIGDIKKVEAFVMKDWAKYGIHIVEPVLKMLPAAEKIKEIKNNGRTVSVYWQSGLETEFSALGETKEPIKIKLKGDKGSAEMTFKDTFAAFRSALQAFVDKKAPPKEFVLKAVQIIESGVAYVKR